MKTTPPKYQYFVWIACSFIVASIAATPQQTPTDRPNGFQITDQSSKILASARLANSEYGGLPEPMEDYAIIGAPDEDYNLDGAAFLSNAGAAYIYEQDVQGEWNSVQKIVAADRAKDDLFGWSAATSGDFAIIGAPHEDHDEHGAAEAANSGSAYIIERDRAGHWKDNQKIVSSDRKPNDKFGSSVSISGNFAIVGAPNTDESQTSLNSISNVGAAYIFEIDDSGKWREVQKITPEDGGAGDGFGINVSIFENQAVIETRDPEIDANSINNFSRPAAAYIFERNAEGLWVQQQKIINPKQTFRSLEKLY